MHVKENNNKSTSTMQQTHNANTIQKTQHETTQDLFHSTIVKPPKTIRTAHIRINRTQYKKAHNPKKTHNI